MKRLKIAGNSPDPRNDTGHLDPLVSFLKAYGSTPFTGKWEQEMGASVYSFRNRIDFAALAQHVRLPETFDVREDLQEIRDRLSGAVIRGILA
jgi:hypothetical protein